MKILLIMLTIISLFQKETSVIYYTFLYKFYKKVLTIQLCFFLLFIVIHTFIVNIRLMIILLLHVIQRTLK